MTAAIAKMVSMKTGSITEVEVQLPVIDPAEVLAQWREVRVVSRADFLTAAKRAGILTQAEAVLAAKGDMPAAFQAIIDGAVTAEQLTQQEAEDALILWAGLSEVRRNHPLIALFAAGMGYTDAQIDALFGWQT